MRNIIIIECKSTGINYIEDITNRGFHPIILETKSVDSEVGEKYKKAIQKEYESIKYDFDLIYEQDTYEKTLENVKELDPILILPGNEKGVILASKLSNDLNLLCNPIENLDAITLKHEMQNKIAEAGLRSIRGIVVSSKEEAIEFYEKEKLNEVVIKPIYSTGSASVRICLNKDEMIRDITELFKKTNRFGFENTELLIQERINGEEYIVNTVSCKGKHRVTTVWKYHKIRTTDGAIVYDTCESVNELNLGEAEMIEYAYDVADALGIQYGPVHGEYMLDEKGPVLIEVNCRPCGANMSAQFLDKISGQHETDSILDAYLKPEAFEEKLKNKYELYSYGALKLFIVPKDTIAKSTPVKNISIKLKSHIQTSIDEIDEEDKKTYFKTEDVGSSCGIVYLAHENYSTIKKDIEYLRSLEKYAFSLILSEENNKRKIDEKLDMDKIKKIFKATNKYGTGLFITDQKIKDISSIQVHPNELEAIGGEFDFVIINLNKSLIENDTNNLVIILLKIFEKVKTGGIIFIPKTTYHLFSGGRRSMEALLKSLDYKIELPPYGVKDDIIASKR